MSDQFLKVFLNRKNLVSFHHYTTVINLLLIFSKRPSSLPLFFAEQCSIIQNSSKLPTDFVTRTHQFLASITCSQGNILKMIQSLNSNKSHGPEKISVRTIN